jgi:hypothetical protein
MLISVLHDNEVENELEIDLCCADCCRSKYGWSTIQYQKACSMILGKSMIGLPNNIDNESKFAEFLKAK